ncbi:MAG: hypothetical protein ACI85O_000515, partial [Saprospiraceae bacterium]
NGGNGLVYWEPGWVSTTCSTPWAIGSHYENATFFGFDDNLKGNGGINWMTEFSTSASPSPALLPLKIVLKNNHRVLQTNLADIALGDTLTLSLYAADGSLSADAIIPQNISVFDMNLPDLAHGIYSVVLFSKKNEVIGKGKVAIFQ